MLIGRPVFYVGLIDGNPAHLAFTKDSLTCELFRTRDAAKQRFSETAIVRIEPQIKVLGLEYFEYPQLSKKFDALQKQFEDLKALRRASWIRARWLLFTTRIRKLLHL